MGKADLRGKPEWFKIAWGEMGTVEIPGPRDNPRIIEYHATTSLKAQDDETSWCSSFVNWCIMKSGIKGTGNASARSWLNWGQRINEPKLGAVVVLWREDPASWKGHVGFYAGPDPKDAKRFLLLGGNQGDRVSIASYPLSRVLAFRWPASASDLK